MENKIAFITGATSGIGKETAFILASNKFDLILTGRRNDRLEKLKSNIHKQKGVKVKTLCFDVRDKEEAFREISSLNDSWKKIDVLINNAGLASGLSHINDGNLDDWEKMIDTNIKGLLYVSRAIMPLMVERGKGQIINIGSIAGKEVYENGNVYCATKHGVDAITKAMRIDLLDHNIKVSSVCPGAVETEFSIVRFKGDQGKANAVYEGYTPLNAIDVAETIYFVISRPDHVNINDILIMPTAQANSSNFNKSK